MMIIKSKKKKMRLNMMMKNNKKINKITYKYKFYINQLNIKRN